ncbi:MAG: Fic family protein [Mariprofundus sp.]
MKWNWQRESWPRFEYDPSALQELEEVFIKESAKLIGASDIVTEEQRQRFTIDLMSEEALKSSRIEGELLNRDSVASSLLQHFGFALNDRVIQANDKERGVAAVMLDNYRSYDKPLTHERLFEWHPCIVTKSLLVRDIGIYRTSPEPMRIVSGYEGKEKVHYEAPPADRVPAEMDAYIQWFNDTTPDGNNPLPALTRAGIAHIYFEAIHPFDDGNGRIGRALSEKALAQSIGRPGLFALSHVIEKDRPEYYRQLEINQKKLSIDSWLFYFSKAALDAIAHSQKLVRFVVEKARLFDRVREQINERQKKALFRMFSEGMDGFEGGMSAKNYMKITGAPIATTTRDLQSLVELGAMVKTGRLKGTRYWLNLGEEFDAPRLEHLKH